MTRKGCVSCPQRSPFLSCRLASPHCLSNVKFNLGCPIFLPVKHCLLLRNDQRENESSVKYNHVQVIHAEQMTFYISK